MKSIEEQERIINEVNSMIDDVICEGWIGDVMTFFRTGPVGVFAKKEIEGIIDAGEEAEEKWKEKLKEKEAALKASEEQEQQEEIEKQIEELNKRLDDIASGITSLKNAREKNTKYKKAEIQFYGKTAVDIEKLKSPEFKRNLLGTMYFKVVGLNQKTKTIDLKTTSFPNTVIIRLEYEKLITNREQMGEVHLIYNKYGFTTHNDVGGDEQKIKFKFLSLE